MSLFKKKQKYTPPVNNSRPVEVRYDLERVYGWDWSSDHIRTDDGEAAICQIRVYNKDGVPMEWATFPEYTDMTDTCIRESKNPFAPQPEIANYTRRYKIVHIYQNTFNSLTLSNVGHSVKCFVIPKTVTSIGGDVFGYSGSKIIVPDGLLEIGKGALFSGGKSFAYMLKYIANYYEGGYYFGSTTNPYVVLLYADSEYENFTIHPDTKIIDHDAFESRPQKTKHIVIPSGVRFIGRQNCSLYFDDIKFEDTIGWYKLPYNDYRGCADPIRTPDKLSFDDGMRKKQK